MSGYPAIVHTEEGMRDGLQIESPDIALQDKIRLLDALSETGLKEIAVGSFVSPKWTPQMACMDDLVQGFHPKPGVRYVCTTLNDKGLERAQAFTDLGFGGIGLNVAPGFRGLIEIVFHVVCGHAESLGIGD